MLRSTLIFAAFLSIGAAASAGGTPDAPAPDNGQDKKICRSIVPTGSIRAKRVCYTRAEWADMLGKDSKQAQDWLDKRSSPLAPASL